MNDEATQKRALSYLTRREHSKKELINKLKVRGFKADAARVVEVLAEKNLQSDSRFAESFIRSKAARGYGPLYIAEALKSHGIANEVVQALLKTVDWQAVFIKEYHKRKSKYDVTHPEGELKLKRALLQRGFSLEYMKE